MDTTPLYDALSIDYDRFVNWHDRLANELPFIERLLRAAGAKRVLDAACGTGKHTLALAERGYKAVGADISAGMVERAKANAGAAGMNTPFFKAGFGYLAQNVGKDFDAVLCLGNSLPHVLSEAELREALVDFASVLSPGGLLLVQNGNFDAVLAGNNRWMEPQSFSEDGKEWLFIRFYDFNQDATLTFNMITLFKDGARGKWVQSIQATKLQPLRYSGLVQMVEETGFSKIEAFGDMAGHPFDPETSGNLVFKAVRS